MSSEQIFGGLRKAANREKEDKRASWDAMRQHCPQFAETVPDWQRLAQRFGGRISGVTAGPDGAELRWGDTDMHDVEVSDVQGA